MYKLLIVEDEEIIRNGLKNSVDWASLGYEICGEAMNGIEALNKIEEEIPDVVLTDVKMPAMDGIELSKLLSEKYPDVETVILSGFADFEYVKSALKFNVFDYILKPTDEELFLDAFIRLKIQLDKKKDERQNQLNMQNMLKEGVEKLRHIFFKELLEGKIIPNNTIADRLDYLEIDFSGRSFAVDVFKQNPTQKDNTNEADDEGIAEMIINTFGKYAINAYLYQTADEIAAILISERDAAQINNLQMEILNSILSGIQGKKNICGTMMAGAGLCYNSAEYIKNSYQQAVSAVNERFFVFDKHVFLYYDKQNIRWDQEMLPAKDFPLLINNIYSEVILGNIEGVESILDKVFENYIDECLNCDAIKKYSYIICFLLSSHLIDFKDSIENLPIYTCDYENDIRKTLTVIDLKTYMKNLLTETSKMIKKYRESERCHHKLIIDTVKTFIEMNFNQDLSLELVSKQVHVTPVYLSFLFKSVTGENFSDFVKRVRLQKAKALLKRADLKIYEIGSLVGYRDYKYFYSQFKKQFGLSPNEFRSTIV